MAILGRIIKRTIEFRKNNPRRRRPDPVKQQERTLRRLLNRAQFTAFGEHYNFSELLDKKDFVGTFRKSVPIFDYNSIFRKWWYRSLNGETYVTWPGQVKYFALSSGTSEASSKHIPVTKEMLKAIQRASVKQLFSQAYADLPKEHFEKGILMLGGSAHLNYNGTYFEGDLSGITTGNVPFWFQHFYKPGNRIAREKDWESKLNEITKKAKDWDIAIICGVPAWIQILFERIIKYYQVDTIHDIWPNLRVYAHGGVSFAPYKKGFEKLLAQPLVYFETYLASEGFIAYQDRPDAKGMKILLNNGIFYEFVPFTDDNFDEDGNILENVETLTIAEVEEGKEYAILLSTCAGAWRYMIGDTIKFTSLEHSEIAITGRTKHFLSLCGEHLSVDNMSKAIITVADEMNFSLKEFTVTGINYENLFAHHWYIGTDDIVDEQVLKEKLDEQLKILNDDYRVERLAALKEIFVTVLPTQVFFDFLKSKGKEGGQNKFPRVLKNHHKTDWENFIGEIHV